MPRTPIYPGEIVEDELEATGLSARKLAETIEVPANRLYQHGNTPAKISSESRSGARRL